MNIKFRRATYLAVSIFTVLLFGACSKNNIYVDITEPYGNNGGDNDNGSSTKEKALVTYSASVEGRNLTRAMSPMGKGLESWLAAYLSGSTDVISGPPAANGDYVTSSPGILKGEQGYKMYLSNNTYNFYAVSCNSSNPAPTFSNGISEPLSNGVDYLWWHALNQDITSSQVNIPITYQHVATQIVLTLSAGTNITLNKINSATITPPKPGAIMDLSTGIISSETSYTQAAAMGINEFTVQYIMLPVKSFEPMTVTLEIMVNGESTARTYVASLTPPSNLLAAGNSYLFRAVINENTVDFPNVSIKEWTDVDETGKPLYPIQN